MSLVGALPAEGESALVPNAFSDRIATSADELNANFSATDDNSIYLNISYDHLRSNFK